MNSRKWGVVCASLVSLSIVGVAQRPVHPDVYELDPEPNWPQPLHKDLSFGWMGALFAESPNRVYILQTAEVPPAWQNAKDPDHPNWPRRGSNEAEHCAERIGCVPGAAHPVVDRKTGKSISGARWEHILLVVDANGKLIESWEQHNHLFTHPHSIVVNPSDPERHVWVVDDQSHQIFKFTRGGTLVMTLGEFRVMGSDKTHFGRPTDIAFLPNGDFYVTDGYVNSRVVKFSKDGKYLMEWGKPGKGPGEFTVPHAIEVDAEGRVYVSDRGNVRIQVFDKDGNYIREIGNIYANALAISKDQCCLWVGQGGANEQANILKYDLNGKLLYSWTRPYGVQPGQIWGLHDFSTDSAGNLYIGQSYGGRAWKFRPKKGADPTLRIGL